MIDISEYLYVVVDAAGRCFTVGDNAREKSPGLAALFREGWRPIREVPFHGSSEMLILLSRDSPEPKGFGFRTS